MLGKMKIIRNILIWIAMFGITTGCSQGNNSHNEDCNYELESFFGETLTVISANRPEGYAVSILRNVDLCLCRLQRGDSINCYLELPDLPSALHDYATSTGTITAEIDIPTRTSLEGDLFFMDVDFDDEVELVVRWSRYNRHYYLCYGMTGRYEPKTGFIKPMKDEPYNNLVTSAYADFPCADTEFDYKNRIIIISESIGVGYHIETVAAYYKPEYDDPRVRVVHKEEHEAVYEEGFTTKIYDLVNDTLKLVKTEFEPWE